MKRFLAGCLTAGLVLSLAACGNDAALEDPSMTGESVSESEENDTIVEVVTDESGEAVTNENGETVTEIYAEIPVLDESGNVVKDDNGNVVTEKKPVKPNGNTGGNSGDSGNSSSNSTNGSTITTKPPKPTNPLETKPPVPEKPTEKPTDPKPKCTWEYLEAESKATLNAINEFRKQNGVAPLTWRQDCQDAANKQAEWCAENSTMYHGASEISQGCWTADADVLIQRWADSPGHRANMLDDWNVYGAVSIYRDSNDYYYVIAHFEYDDSWEVAR